MEDSNVTCANSRYLFRFCVAFVSIFAPFILLIRGVYGSFLFCFTIPILWQIGYLNKSFSSLGLRIKSLAMAIVLGVASGVMLGFLGVGVIRFFGLTGHFLSDAQYLQLGVGAFKLKFSLAKELGYQLLANSNNTRGLLLYLSFSILVIGLGEEIFWRGFIQKKIAHRIKGSAAVWITALLFTIIHFYIFIFLPLNKGIILFGLIGIAGLIWGYLYQRISNIWSVALSHGITAAIIWKYFFG